MPEHIVIRAEDDSLISVLMKYVEDKKAYLVTHMGNSLLNNEDRDAIVAAAEIHAIDGIVEVLKEAIEEQTKGEGDESTNGPTYFTN